PRQASQPGASPDSCGQSRAGRAPDNVFRADSREVRVCEVIVLRAFVRRTIGSLGLPGASWLLASPGAKLRGPRLQQRVSYARRELFTPCSCLRPLVFPLGAQECCPQQIMSKHVQQHDSLHLGQTSYTKLVQPAVAGMGVDAFGRAGSLFVDLLGL